MNRILEFCVNYLILVITSSRANHGDPSHLRVRAHALVLLCLRVLSRLRVLDEGRVLSRLRVSHVMQPQT